VADDFTLVFNAGSSSLKFCVYRRHEAGAWRLDARGQIEGIGAAPHFSRKDAVGVDLENNPLGTEVRAFPPPEVGHPRG
jgi:acetate kinase